VPTLSQPPESQARGLFGWACGKLGIVAPRHAYQHLRSLHAGRPYHNWAHIRDKLAWTLQLSYGLSSRQLAENVLADFYHDAIYDPRAKDNEERSAELLGTQLGVERACELVLLTKGHATGLTDLQDQIMVDSDLAILQSEPEAYEAYARAIRQEYSFVPNEAYRSGRAQVLKSFNREDLFYCREDLNSEVAMRNIARELKGLEEGILDL
jgi:predicted metal-dependent HD superfamily phosphohydrolase